MRAFGVIARQPHRLHDGFGAGHVEGDFVKPGNLAQPFDVVGDGRVIEARAPDRADARASRALVDAFLVEIIAEDVDAVGAGEVVEDVAVDVGDGDAGRGFHEGAGAEIFLHQAAVLERHPIGPRELQVGYLRRGIRSHRAALGIALAIEPGEAEESVLAFGCDLRRRAIGAKETVDVEFVVRDQPRDGARHLGMPGQRPVLGAGQRNPRGQFRKSRGGSRRDGGEGENQSGRIHAANR